MLPTTHRILGRAGLATAAISAGVALSAAAPAAAGTVHSAPVAANATATAQASADHPHWCTTEWILTADGVRIHAGPSTAAPVVGLAYGLEPVGMVRDNNPVGWSKIDDYRTGVTGWVRAQFVISGGYCD